MARLRTQPASISWLLTILTASLLALPVQSLYFFIDGAAPKCFFEELPKDTLVVGHYQAEEFLHEKSKYENHDAINIFISVDEVFDNDHRVVSQNGMSKGRFTFSAADSGDHKICFTSSGAAAGGWLNGGATSGIIKLTLDLAIGETSSIDSSDKNKIQDIVSKVKDLNGRLQDIRREQVWQREREAEFRDQSETTNARVVRWTLVQLAVLGITCAWQLSHLRAFFIKQKLT
ncbi:MAG: emp24p/erv25p- protein [Sclerophora amabilis]|nr:MAG: emp24p/erv25p- protein [Sclerophora amabilis]